jgi:hypothetical protein
LSQFEVIIVLSKYFRDFTMHFFFELLLLAGLVALLIQLPAKFLAIALAIGAIVWFLLPGGPGGFHFGIGCDWLTRFGDVMHHGFGHFGFPFHGFGGLLTVALLIAVVWLAWKAFGRNKSADKTNENV